MLNKHAHQESDKAQEAEDKSESAMHLAADAKVYSETSNQKGETAKNEAQAVFSQLHQEGEPHQGVAVKRADAALREADEALAYSEQAFQMAESARNQAEYARGQAEDARNLAEKNRDHSLSEKRQADQARQTAELANQKAQQALQQASHAQEMAVAAEKRYQLVLEGSNDGFWDWDIQQGALYWNDRFFNMLGISSIPQERSLEQESLFARVHPDDRAQLLANIQKALAQTQHFQESFRMQHEDGHYLYCCFRGRVIFDEANQPIRMAGTISDITERKQAEEVLQYYAYQQELLSKLGIRALSKINYTDLMQEIVNVVAQGLRVEFCKILKWFPEEQCVQFCEFTGWPEEKVAGKKLPLNEKGESHAGYTIKVDEPVIVYDIFSETRFAPSNLYVEVGVVSGVSVIIEGETDEAPFGVLEADTREHRQFNQDDVNFLQSAANILASAVQRYNVQQALQEREADLRRFSEELEQRVIERTTRLEGVNKELEAFSYSISHDLRTPLRSIDGFSQALLNRCGDRLDETEQNYLQRVREASQRMGRLIDDLLSMSRLNRSDLHKAPVNLSNLAHRVIQELQRQEPEQPVVFSAPEKLMAYADPSLLSSVIQNLLSNAWKFSASRGEAVIELGGFMQNGITVYYVRDNGVGFDMTYVDKLFKPFESLHSTGSFEGSGIGLAIVQRIVERHGGKVWAESEVDKGTTLFFTLEPTPEEKEAIL